MEYEYWGYVEISKADGHCKQWINGVGYIITAPRLPKWVRDKIVLLDFMEDNIRLQCQSTKTTFITTTRYYLYKSEDEKKRP